MRESTPQTQKIDDIRSKLDGIDPSSNQPDYSTRSSVQEHSYTGTPFTNFEPISSEGIKKLVLNAPNKTCDNDPIPTKIVKDCINELLPTISSMVNLSLSSGHFPDIWKEGLVNLVPRAFPNFNRKNPGNEIGV